MNWFVFINTNQSFFNLNRSFIYIAQISENLEKLVESFSTDNFVFDLLLAYGTPKQLSAVYNRVIQPYFREKI